MSQRYEHTDRSALAADFEIQRTTAGIDPLAVTTGALAKPTALLQQFPSSPGKEGLCPR